MGETLTLGDDKRNVRGEKALMLVVPADKITAPRAKEDIFMVVGGMRIFFCELARVCNNLLE